MTYMKPPFEIDIPPDNYCPYCKAALIELYDDHNKPRYYKSLLNKYQENKLEITNVFRKITLSHFKCQSSRIIVIRYTPGVFGVARART